MIDAIDESADGNAVIVGSDGPSGVLRLLDAAELSPGMAVSLVGMSRTLTTWPQLDDEVQLGATMVADADRRIGIGEPPAPGRVRTDVGAALDERARLSPDHAGSLRDLQYSFRQLTATERDASQALVLRLFCAPRRTVRSRRRSLPLVHEPLHG